MPDEPERTSDDPAGSWDDADPPSDTPTTDEIVAAGGLAPVDGAAPIVEETVGTGSYVAVSCVAAMALLLVVLIVGLLISRWVG